MDVRIRDSERHEEGLICWEACGGPFLAGHGAGAAGVALVRVRGRCTDISVSLFVSLRFSEFEVYAC